MDAVILFSHGSLLCGAGEALKRHAERLRERGIAPIVEVGYLNYSAPPFAQTVADVVAQGATRVLVAPYFLVPGKFVKVDLPRAVDAARAAHPHVEFTVAAPIGFDTRLADALIDSARAAFGPERWREDLRRAPRFCRVNPECPLYGTVNCPTTNEKKEERKEKSAGAQFIAPNPGLLAAPNTQHPTPEHLNTRTPEHPTPNTQHLTPNTQHLTPSTLLVMVHGSPRPIANEEMFQVVEEIRERGEFPIVEVGFMECNAPSIPDAIAACVAKGAASVLATPYFLHTGTHVADDLPTLLEEAQEIYPAISFAMGTYLGESERLTDILADRIYAITDTRQ